MLPSLSHARHAPFPVVDPTTTGDAPSPSLSAASLAPVATQHSPTPTIGKATSSLSSLMAPFFHSECSERSKALRWSKESDYSDYDYNSAPTPKQPDSDTNAIR